LLVTLGNFGELDGLSIVGTVTSPTPGVVFLDDGDTWASLAPGEEKVNEGVLRFTTDPLLLECGDTLQFQLVPDEASGCAAQTSYFEVRLGDREVDFQDDFEADQGWTVDLVASTATSGTWTRGDPDGTSFQPGEDINDPGTFCYFTAPNPNGIGGDDVDNGVTVLVSPVIDLSGQSEAILVYWRWFANRDLGEDAEDFFRVQATDGIGGWVTLENLGTNESAPSWTEVEFDLEDFITLTDQVQVRFMASDGPATGNLIEAAIDDVRIERPVCDDTPACFTEPTFAGADTALPGASCGETVISWSDATSNCLNATISYSVYRGTDPAFLPDATNRIASSLVGTSFSDTLLDPDIDYYYIVRAYDSRSGEDSNLNRLQVTSPGSPDLQAPLFDGIDAAASGANCGEVSIQWSAAAETCNLPVSYRVYRSTDPAFVPGPANLVASTTSLGIVDTALVPGISYTYVVRASDDLDNVDTNDIRLTVGSTNLDLTLLAIDFEPDNADWQVVDPNDAVTGNWEWGDPEDTGTQPGDDHTPGGVNCWVTGLAESSGNDNNDIDDGSTTLRSKSYDITGAVDPAVRYARWFTNDTGQNPGEDPLIVEVSDNDGLDWHLLEQVDAGPL
ncbi:MAG: hypothetical protein R3344_10705, partial [Acidobacteriota bacterium]|nr:hypothetical protein [Acidobacteriota bacterium]